MTYNFTPKNADIFYCNLCDFKCSKKSDWERHISTKKHIRLTNTYTNYADYAESNIFICECGNKYKHRQSLYNHKKKCNFNSHKSDNNDKELIMMMLKDNSELKHVLLEVVKNGITTNTNSNNNNNITNNNHFNLNLFLNETCKNAMSITEFVEQIPLTINDLEDTARLGYVEGISKIFIKGLKDLEVNERPIHCSDAKRETLYIKEGDIWEKDDSDKTKLTNAIRKVGHRNIRMIPEWKKKYPDCEDYYSKKNDLYLKIVNQSMCGGTEEETETNYNKIKKNIIKEVVIEK
jgi:hypothetical protein